MPKPARPRPGLTRATEKPNSLVYNGPPITAGPDWKEKMLAGARADYAKNPRTVSGNTNWRDKMAGGSNPDETPVSLNLPTGGGMGFKNYGAAIKRRLGAAAKQARARRL